VRKRTKRKDLPDYVYFQHGAYYFVVNNKWMPLGKDYVAAMIKYTELNSDNKHIFTMGQLFDKYTIEIIPGKAKATQEDNLSSMKFLRTAFSHMQPEEITPQDIYAYMDARNAPVRANRDKSLLSHVFKKAIRWGVLKTNPCRDVESNPETPRKRLITHEEFWAVYDFIPHPMIKIAMIISGLTGLRQNKVLSLTKSLHIKKDKIEIDSGKRGLELSIERTEEVNQALMDAEKIHSVKSIFIIHKKDGQPYTRNGFKTMFGRWMDRASGHYIQQEDETDEDFQAREKRMLKRYPPILEERFTYHDIRAMAGSNTDNDDLLGHRNKSTFHRVYRRKAVEVTPVSLFPEKFKGK